MARRVAIIQSNYIPWKGYFDILRAVDEFILFDDVQYTRRDWRNRNRIKTAHGLKWLTIPVQVKGHYEQRIRDTLVDGDAWRETHWKTLLHHYGDAPHFGAYRAALEEAYHGCREERLSAVNRRFLECVMGLLGIETPLRWSWEYEVCDGKTERLVSLCRQAGATEYVSGPAARAYIDARQFEEAGIALTFVDYAGYPEYPQSHPPFEHGVTVLDLLFHTGPDAPRYLKAL